MHKSANLDLCIDIRWGLICKLQPPGNEIDQILHCFMQGFEIYTAKAGIYSGVFLALLANPGK